MDEYRRPAADVAQPLAAWYLPSEDRPDSIIVDYADPDQTHPGVLVLTLTTPPRAVALVQLLLTWLIRGGHGAELATIERYLAQIKVNRSDDGGRARAA